MQKTHAQPNLRSVMGICLSACALSMLILFAVYAVRGIWPFGSDNVAYADTAQFYLPAYYKIWDAFHGAPIHVSWTAGLAEAGSLTLRDVLWLPNLVFLFVERSQILESLSLYLAVNLSITAILTGLAVHLRFHGLHPFWQILFTVLYTFSGYVLQYYSTFDWIYIIALFPLLLFSLERLLRDGKYLLYIAVYTALIIRSVYFTYMLTAFVLLFSFLYVVILLPRDLRGQRAFCLGVSTAAAFGLSAWNALSSSSALVGSSRFQDNMESGLLKGFTTWSIPAMRHTLAMLLGMALAIAILLRAVRRRGTLPEEQRVRAGRTIWFFSAVFALLAIPMVFTNIDTAWHFGQYNFFPMRYGFVVPGTLLAAAGIALEREQDRDPVPRAEVSRSRVIGRCALAAALAAALLILEPRLGAFFREYGTVFLTSLGARDFWLQYFPLFAGCGMLFTALYLVLLRFGDRRVSMVLAALAVLAQVFTNASGLIAPDDDHVPTHEYDPAYVEMSDSLYDYFSETGIGALTRVKNVDNSLNAGYPAVAGVSAVSSVMSGNSALRLGVFRELGYSINYFRILDTGGTVLSDMMFGVDVILSARELDESLYTDTGAVIDGIRIGTPRYAGAVGLTYEEGALDGYLDEMTLEERLNLLYRTFTGSEEPIAAVPELTLSSEGDDIVRYTLSITTEEEGVLYLSTEELMLNMSMDGETYYVPSYQNPDFHSYPAAFNLNLLCLGLREPGTYAVSFLSSEGLTEEDFTVVTLSRAALDSFHDDTGMDGARVEGGMWDDSVTVTLSDVGEGRRLFLPLNYSARWRVTVNGASVPAERAMGTFLSVPLDAGDNIVTITRGPAWYGMEPGHYISLVTLLLLAAWLILRRRVRIPLPGWAGITARVLLAAAAVALFLFLYAAPAALFLHQGTVAGF